MFQDIAVVVDEEVEAQTVIETRARRRAGPSCAAIDVFDLYRGEQVGEGKKSLALRLEFRSADRTLTDEEVAGSASRSSTSWPTRSGATLRE